MINKYFIQLKKTNKQIKEKLVKYFINPIHHIYNHFYNYVYNTKHSTKDSEPFFKYLNQNYDDNDNVFSDSESPVSNNDMNDDTISNEDDEVDISFDD